LSGRAPARGTRRHDSANGGGIGAAAAGIAVAGALLAAVAILAVQGGAKALPRRS
jgi:hypothetical protein